MGNALRRVILARAKLTLLYRHIVAAADYAAVRAKRDTGMTTHAFSLIHSYSAEFIARERARNATFETNRIVAMSAINGEMHAAVIFHPNTRGRLRAAVERKREMRFSRRAEHAPIFAQPATQTPFFVHINSSHGFVLLTRPRA